MAGFCCKCGRKIIDPDMIFNKFGRYHEVSYKKRIEIERRFNEGLCWKCNKKRGVR